MNNGATFTMGGLNVNGAIAIDSSTLVVDEINHRVGIGSASPSNRLSVSAGNIELTASNSLQWGITADRASITGSDDNLLLKADNGTLNGSIQLGSGTAILNNNVTFGVAGGNTNIVSASTQVNFYDSGQSSNAFLTGTNVGVTLNRETSINGALLCSSTLELQHVL